MSIKERITQAILANADVSVKRINDTQYIGFHARFGKPRTDGTRLISYYYFYRIGGRNGRQVNYFIGNSEAMDAGVARRIAMQIEPHVKAGKDILKMKFEAEKSQVRLKDFWRFSGQQYFTKHYKNSSDAIGNIERYVLVPLGSVHLDKLTHKLIALRVIQPMLDQRKINQCYVVISLLKNLFQHAIANDYLGKLPMSSFELPPRSNMTVKQIATPLSGAEIKGVYYRASKATKRSVYLATLRLQILTGQSLSIILASYRQDIKGNTWSLRSTNGKLTGKLIPLSGPLKALIKEVIATYCVPQSLFLFPSKGKRREQDLPMDARAVAKSQQRFIEGVHGHKKSMTSLLNDIEQAMIDVGVAPLVVAYLFDQPVADYLTLSPKDKLIGEGLSCWYRG